MTTPWVCGDLPTAVAQALHRGTIANLAGAVPTDEDERRHAYRLLCVLAGDQQQDSTVQELLRRLASPSEAYHAEQQRSAHMRHFSVGPSASGES